MPCRQDSSRGPSFADLAGLARDPGPQRPEAWVENTGTCARRFITATGRSTANDRDEVDCATGVHELRRRRARAYRVRFSCPQRGRLTVKEAGSAGFHRALGLADATALVAGSMIGSGIFLVSAQMTRELGSAGWLLAVWALAGLMTVLAAALYGYLFARFPRAGGQYVYLREAFGPVVGFL